MAAGERRIIGAAPGPQAGEQLDDDATYRIQIVKLPRATRGRWWQLWIGSESEALLLNLEIPAGNVLPLIASSVSLLQGEGGPR